jgi:serine protease Do
VSLTLLAVITSLLFPSIDSHSVGLQQPALGCCKLTQSNKTIGRIKTYSIANNNIGAQTSEEIANQVTVRILGEGRGGSGVIVARRGQTYTVLTNEHVLVNTKNNGYTIITVDGFVHNGTWSREFQFGGADLAIVKFNTKDNYQVVVLGNSIFLSLGDRTYAAGFPNYYFPENSNIVESTHNWGRRAFRLTVGNVGMIPLQSLREGYGLGYTNEIVDGMSGGPVLNQRGELVGINGKLKYSLQGLGGYLFNDGNTPSQKLFEQMQSLSWAIPVSSFVQFLSVL